MEKLIRAKVPVLSRGHLEHLTLTMDESNSWEIREVTHFDVSQCDTQGGQSFGVNWNIAHEADDTHNQDETNAHDAVKTVPVVKNRIPECRDMVKILVTGWL